jgi:hypothetical protein
MNTHFWIGEKREKRYEKFPKTLFSGLEQAPFPCFGNSGPVCLYTSFHACCASCYCAMQVDHTAGFLHSFHSELADASGCKVRLIGVNWFGFETHTFSPHGLWARNW